MMRLAQRSTAALCALTLSSGLIFATGAPAGALTGASPEPTLAATAEPTPTPTVAEPALSAQPTAFAEPTAEPTTAPAPTSEPQETAQPKEDTEPPGTAPSPDAATSAQAVDPALAEGESRYIVLYERGANMAAEAAALRSQGVAVGRVFADALSAAVVNATPAAAARLERSRGVVSVELDKPVSISATQSPAPWGLDRIDQRFLPLSGSYISTETAAGVDSYIVDTGVLATHADFGGRVTAGYVAPGAIDPREPDIGSGDCNGHGTHVAGTTGGATYGVAKATTIVPVRVLDCAGEGFSSDVVAGLDWIAQQHQAGEPAVMNLSLGGPANGAVDTAVQGVIDDGVTAVTAAGNAGANACTESPARVPAALTVAASDSADRQPGFSNYGSCVDLYAPGVSITSAWNTSNTATATLSGTSMSSPHVAGAAALLLSQNPALTPAQVSTAIIGTATPGVVNFVTAGTPNRLLFTGARRDACGPGQAAEPLTRDLSSATIRSDADVLAADANGVLWVYPANGAGGFMPRAKLGGGWSSLKTGFVSDWNQDGVFDIVAQWTDGRMSLYPGKLGGGFVAPSTIGTGWGQYQVTIGKWCHAAPYPGIVGTDSAGALWYYSNPAGAGVGKRFKIGAGWRGLYTTMADRDSDGNQDILATFSDGTLKLYRSNGKGGFISEARPQIGRGWASVNPIVTTEGFDGTGTYGLLGRFSDGRLIYYPIVDGAWGGIRQVGKGWSSMNVFR